MGLLILGIDTSCDDTSVSVVDVEKERFTVVSNIVSSQAEVHKKFGGIVPEIASRKHIEVILPLFMQALDDANIRIDDIDVISVCKGPGLIGSLIVGCSFAKSISYVKKIPLVSVNHLEGHLFSSFPVEKVEFPFLGLIVSGGHTTIVRVDAPLRYRELGKTRDDAAGEAFDKVAKLLGLGYPGGPVIDELSKKGDREKFRFTRPYLPDTFDFSFSGLKTAVLNLVKSMDSDDLKENIPDIVASFQSTVIDVLLKKVQWALKKEGLKRLMVSGGVAANSELRNRFKELSEEMDIELHIPPPRYCTDNAVMISVAGYFYYREKMLSGIDLNPVAYLSLS